MLNLINNAFHHKEPFYVLLDEIKINDHTSLQYQREFSA